MDSETLSLFLPLSSLFALSFKLTRSLQHSHWDSESGDSLLGMTLHAPLSCATFTSESADSHKQAAGCRARVDQKQRRREAGMERKADAECEKRT